MSDVKRILDALVALTKALPGAEHAHLTIGVHSCTDEGLRALVANGGRLESYESDDRASTWDAVTLHANSAMITAYSQHREVAKPADPAVVDAALAQAAEALS